MCIAADSGIDHARALGRVPDLVVGDFDSVTDEGLAWAAEVGATIDRHPSAKDETDLEIALDHALAAEPDHIVVAGIGGGRLDHLLANFAVLAARRFAAVRIDGLVQTSLVSVVHTERQLQGDPGELVSLLSMHGDAHGVTTVGLGYPLRNESLRSGSSRGVSNYFEQPLATVSVAEGTLLAIQPERLIPAADRPAGTVR